MAHLVESFKVLSTLAAQRIVALDTAAGQTVVYPAAVTIPLLGVTIDTVKDTTSSIPVQMNGKAWVYFNDSCTTNALVTSNNLGQAIPYVETTAGGYVIGRLADVKVNTTGTVAQIIVNPHFKSIP